MRGRQWRAGGRGGRAVAAVALVCLAGCVEVATDDAQDGATPSPTATTTTAGAPPPSPSATPTTPAPAPTDAVAAVRGDAGGALTVREAQVVEVVDGDTVDLADGTRVRLAIVDTPEVHGGHERCGPEASAFTADAVVGEAVLVVRPDGAPRTDPYGRTLAEVVVRDGPRSLNVALVAAGLARVDERYTDEDPDLARRARAAAADAPSPSCAPVDADG